jgi:deazaflavin-dependent oxidoreductase (nitroreductase family)
MANRKPLGPIGRFFAGAPRHLYRLGLGRLLGRRFVMVEHTGRVSGRPRETVLEVIRADASSMDVAAAWGPRSDWLRNVLAEPSVRVSSGRLRSAPATAGVLDVEVATAVFDEYARVHPKAARAVGRALDLAFTDPADVASAVPVVRFTIG